MSRTDLYKAAYFGQIAAWAALFVGVVLYFHLPLPAAGLAALCLLIPGRILGFFWRDLLRGLRLLKAGEYAESKRHSELFLQKVRRKPWLKKLIWLGSGTYSRDPEALALSNLGGAEIGLGEFEAARVHLEASISLDNQNPLPVFNMGVLFHTMGDQRGTENWFEQARRLGYSKSVIDRIVMSSQSRFAAIDGQGRS